MSNNIGVVGLGVMGANLARNIESRGFPVVGYDVDAEKTQAFLDGPASGTQIGGAQTPEALADALERPRRVLIMVPAGKAVDSVIAHLQPHLATWRHPDRRRQFVLRRHRSAHRRARGGRHALRRHWRLRR